MDNNEPTLHNIEDYNGQESTEKKLTVWIVILSGLLIGSVYAIIAANTSVSDLLVDKKTTGIVKY